MNAKFARRRTQGLRSSGRGFTLMEILIAMTIMLIGLIPMLAVFRVALESLNRAIEDTYAAAVAQSVMDAIRLGIREMKVEHADPTNPIRFFLLDHDGSEDLEADRRGFLRDADISSPAVKAQILTKDYCILLPNDNETDTSTVGTSGGTIGRAYLFPRKDRGDNAARKPVQYTTTRITRPDGTSLTGRKPKIEKIYKLGKKLQTSTNEVEKRDSYVQYGFAFTIRPAKAPDPLAPTSELRTQRILPGLYEVVVMVFRNFSPDENHRRNNPVGGPGREFITYVSE